jgi:replication factor C large subunit
MTESQPWSSRFRPCTLKEIVGNERSIRQLQTWLKSWERGIPKQRAAFLHGPPGVGKTCSVVALANDLGYDLLEVNASDYRTRKKLDALIGRSIRQRVTITGKRRMILFDELEGISGRQDHGGIGAIAAIIKKTEIPIVLVATNISDRWEDKFRPLRGVSLHIEYNSVPFSLILMRIRAIAEELEIHIDEDVLELLADRAEGDLRSTINDLEVVARGRTRVTKAEASGLSVRDRKDYTPDALMKMFSAKTLRDARRIISSAHIPYDDLFNWIYENLPLVLDDASDLAEGMEALSRADIHQTRARRTQNYRLIKYMFDEMTGGVALSRRNSDGMGLLKLARIRVAELGFPPRDFTIIESPDGIMIKPNRYLKDDWRRVNEAFRSMGAGWVRGGGCWNLPYFRSPQLIWRYRRTWHSRRRRRSIAERVADKCHISTKEAVAEVIPLVKVIFEENEAMARDISGWLRLEDKEADWLKG